MSSTKQNSMQKLHLWSSFLIDNTFIQFVIRMAKFPTNHRHTHGEKLCYVVSNIEDGPYLPDILAVILWDIRYYHNWTRNYLLVSNPESIWTCWICWAFTKYDLMSYHKNILAPFSILKYLLKNSILSYHLFEFWNTDFTLNQLLFI